MDVVGISKQEQDVIFRAAAAVLHLRNVEFTKGIEIDSSVLKDDKSKFHLQTSPSGVVKYAPKIQKQMKNEIVVQLMDSFQNRKVVCIFLQPLLGSLLQIQMLFRYTPFKGLYGDDSFYGSILQDKFSLFPSYFFF